MMRRKLCSSLSGTGGVIYLKALDCPEQGNEGLFSRFPLEQELGNQVKTI